MIERAYQLKKVLSYVVLMVLSLYGSLVGICRSNAENGNSGEKASPDTISMRFLLTQNIAVGRIATHISRALIGSSQYGTFFSLVRVLYNPCGTSQWYIGMIRGNNGST